MLAQTSASRRLDLGGESCEAGSGTGWASLVPLRREHRRYGPAPCCPRKRLRLDAAEHDATSGEVQLGLITDEDQLERDDALAGGRRLDEQPPIEL